MTIIDFYTGVSRLLERYRLGLQEDEALRELRLLNAKAEESGIDAKVSEDILKRVHVFDDESSFDDDNSQVYRIDDSDDSSYD